MLQVRTTLPIDTAWWFQMASISAVTSELLVQSVCRCVRVGKSSCRIRSFVLVFVYVTEYDLVNCFLMTYKTTFTN